MPTSFLGLCALLSHLCNENGVEPPEMTLTFDDPRQRDAFTRILHKEFAHLSALPFGEARFDSCHGIKFLLSVKHQR